MALDIDTLNSEWGAGPGTDDGLLVGRNADSKVAFFGNEPVARGSLTGSTATAAQIVTELARLGIVINAG